MIRTLSFTIQKDQDNTDIRTFVRKYLGFSARVLTALKYEGQIILNGRIARSVDLLHIGDRLELTLFDDICKYDPVHIPLNILYEDEDFLVIQKEANMPVHPSPGHDRDSVLNAVAYYFKDCDRFVFRPLYRLDRDTTGVLVLAKNKFSSGAELSKMYTAICEGVVPENGRIDTPIGLLPGHSIQRGTGFGQHAVTEYSRVSTDGRYSLVNFRLLTGRTHQIRVHMSSIGHSVAGDDLYGGHLDVVKNQVLCCSEVRIYCPALEFDKTIRSDFHPNVKELFPSLWI